MGGTACSFPIDFKLMADKAIRSKKKQTKGHHLYYNTVNFAGAIHNICGLVGYK